MQSQDDTLNKKEPTIDEIQASFTSLMQLLKLAYEGDTFPVDDRKIIYDVCRTISDTWFFKINRLALDIKTRPVNNGDDETLVE